MILLAQAPHGYLAKARAAFGLAERFAFGDLREAGLVQ
jgi:hypothetical protein